MSVYSAADRPAGSFHFGKNLHLYEKGASVNGFIAVDRFIQSVPKNDQWCSLNGISGVLALGLAWRYPRGITVTFEAASFGISLRR
jgi:hypothetical protein